MLLKKKECMVVGAAGKDTNTTMQLARCRSTIIATMFNLMPGYEADDGVSYIIKKLKFISKRRSKFILTWQLVNYSL